jgi:SAM-dependent methyltransferase
MKTLDEIGIDHQTDKASQFSRTYAQPHDYLRHLEKFFAPLRDEMIKMVEIGVGGGESIRMWLEYFAVGRIVGVDNVCDTNQWNTVDPPADRRYRFVHGDQTDETMWRCFKADYGSDFDIAIDDGSHFNDGVIVAFQGLWPLLRSGGLYVVEDIGCSYGAGNIFVKPGWPSHTEWLKGLIDEMHQGRGDIDFVYQAKELAILRKK